MSTIEDPSGNLHRIEMFCSFTHDCVYAVNELGTDRILFLKMILEAVKGELAGVLKDNASESGVSTSNRPRTAIPILIEGLSKEAKTNLWIGLDKLYNLVLSSFTADFIREARNSRQFDPKANDPLSDLSFSILLRVLVEGLK